MKSEKNSSVTRLRVLRHPTEPTKHAIFHHPLLALLVALVITALPARAQTITNSLLANPSFDNANSGHAIPTGWTYFTPPLGGPPNYWIINPASANDQSVEKVDADGSSTGYWWKQWNINLSGAVNNDVAGLYQTFGSAPGSVYQADAYITSSSGDELVSTNDESWIQVEFLDSNSNLLSLYKSGVYTINIGVTTWFPFVVSNACDITQPVSTGDTNFNTYAVTGAVSQLVAPARTALVRFRLCDLFYLNDGGSVYFDDAALEQVSGPVPPTINNLNPQNEIFVPPSSNLTFDVTSPSGITINNSGIQVMLNGSNVSSGLVITGSASSKNVSYSGLQSNATYNVAITVVDSSGLQSSLNTSFQTTWLGVPAPSYIWEAEDFDFSSGMYIDNPDLCNAPGNSDCYFGQVGSNNVDEFSTGAPPAQFYRGTNDGIGTQPSGDFSRPNLTAADRVDYCINPFNNNEWVNYTRDWPASTNWIIGRFANGGAEGGDILSLVTPTSTNVLGYFVVSTTPSWSTFENFYLMSTDGVNRAVVVLNGKETLQLFAGVNGTANALPTFFMLVPGQTDLPVLSGLYPDGLHAFEDTNTLSFTVTTLGATFPANGIQVFLDGINVSSDLVLTGSSSSNHVVFPYLGTNQTHTVVITATNSLGHGITVSNGFDTFYPNNYVFQAEDYDFSAGQYVPSASYSPDCYQSYSSVTNVDYHHTINGGEPTDGSDYTYRQDGIPQGITLDTSSFSGPFAADQFAFDYNFNWYGGGDWVNYTRDYPPGAYNVFARTSGAGAYTMDFGRVTSGWGTTNQAVQPLGQFSSVGVGENTFFWVPLTDAGGVAPVTVNITGPTNTFKVLTPTGLCYPNYFMLVPASHVHLSAARSGANVNISFAAQTGSIYRLFYRTNLTAGSWTLLQSVLGKGPVQSVTDSAPGGSVRFYTVTSP
ncbi:MAG TPA: hypothetical protein VGY56_00945 [Verrucomicrobiae bacterium]|nr:hypothetical protein [Verrucomicrobiae bacterium]